VTAALICNISSSRRIARWSCCRQLRPVAYRALCDL